MGSGAQAGAAGFTSTAVGSLARATALQSVALGTSSVADRDYTVSIGNASVQRQLVNLAAGTADTDAVNVAQVVPLVNAFGAGASFTGGFFAAPTYVIQGGSYRDVGSAFAAVDGSLTDLYARVADAGGSGSAGPQGPAGPTGPQGPTGPDRSARAEGRSGRCRPARAPGSGRRQ